MRENKEFYRKQADFCKFMANEKRIEILFILKDGEKCVEEITEEIGINLPNVSQHLAVMKKKGIVNVRRVGVKMFYSISNEKIFQVCEIMRDLMMEQFQKKKHLLN